MQTLPKEQSKQTRRGIDSIDDPVLQMVTRKARDMMEFITLMLCPFPDVDDMVENLRDIWNAACKSIGEDPRKVKMTKKAASCVS